MGLEYLPIHEYHKIPYKFMVNVDKYSIHGAYWEYYNPSDPFIFGQFCGPHAPPFITFASGPIL